MTDITEATASDVTSAIEKLLYGEPQTPATVETDDDESPEPQPTPQPQPVQEPDDDEEAETPVTEPSAEVEGGLVAEPSEPDKPLVAEPKAPEAPKTQPEADKQQDAVLAQLNQLIPALQHAIAGEFGDIKTFADLQRVATEDPSRYNRYVIHQAQLQHAQTEQQKLQMAAHARWYQSEQEKLAKALPEITDKTKGPALRNELRAYALKQGYTEQQIAFASSHDVLTLHKAMQFEKWQAEQKAQAAKVAAEQAKAKDKAAKAPPVSKPGVASDEKRTKAQERLQQFQKSGKPDDLATYLQEIGIA